MDTEVVLVASPSALGACREKDDGAVTNSGNSTCVPSSGTEMSTANRRRCSSRSTINRRAARRDRDARDDLDLEETTIECNLQCCLLRSQASIHSRSSIHRIHATIEPSQPHAASFVRNL